MKLLCLIILCARVINSSLVLLCIYQWKVQLRESSRKEVSTCSVEGVFHSGNPLSPLDSSLKGVVVHPSFVHLKHLGSFHRFSLIPEEPQRALESLMDPHTMKSHDWKSPPTAPAMISASLFQLSLVFCHSCKGHVSLPGEDLVWPCPGDSRACAGCWEPCLGQPGAPHSLPWFMELDRRHWMLSQQGGTASGHEILFPESCQVHLSSILCSGASCPVSLSSNNVPGSV